MAYVSPQLCVQQKIIITHSKMSSFLSPLTQFDSLFYIIDQDNHQGKVIP